MKPPETIQNHPNPAETTRTQPKPPEYSQKRPETTRIQPEMTQTRLDRNILSKKNNKKLETTNGQKESE